jgi:23S rRNA (pseudouridine1915-N3)-methyltransferase
MLYIEILQIASTKNSQIAALEADYEKRLKNIITELKVTTLQASKKDQREAVHEEEKERFLEKLKASKSGSQGSSVLIALDERGKQHTTEKFAELLKDIRDFKGGKVQMLIGGSHGLHPDLRAKADHVMALSKMTFTHEMVRIFLKEQIYRAAMILSGRKYHK